MMKKTGEEVIGGRNTLGAMSCLMRLCSGLGAGEGNTWDMKLRRKNGLKIHQLKFIKVLKYMKDYACIVII